MLRRGERAVVIGAVVTLALAALAGILSAPAEGMDDLRLSTHLAGPNGAKGLAQVLTRLDLTVEQRRRSYFDLATDSTRPPRHVLLAFLDIVEPTLRERVAIRDYVDRGGRIFVAGETGIETCFGYVSSRVGDFGDVAPVQFRATRPLPDARRLLRPIPAESLVTVRGRRRGGRSLPGASGSGAPRRHSAAHDRSIAPSPCGCGSRRAAG